MRAILLEGTVLEIERLLEDLGLSGKEIPETAKETCKECGKEFVPKNALQKYCSIPCRQKRNMRLMRERQRQKESK